MNGRDDSERTVDVVKVACVPLAVAQLMVVGMKRGCTVKWTRMPEDTYHYGLNGDRVIVRIDLSDVGWESRLFPTVDVLLTSLVEGLRRGDKIDLLVPASFCLTGPSSATVSSKCPLDNLRMDNVNKAFSLIDMGVIDEKQAAELLGLHFDTQD